VLKFIQIGIFVFFTAIALSAQAPVHSSRRFAVYSDRIVEGEYEARALSSTSLLSTYERKHDDPARWTLQTDLSAYPTLRSSLPIIDSTYNLSLEELSKDIRPDRTFMAGAEWNGVWTRDISYSILLSLAMVEPELARNSLLAKVNHGEIVQDTGTGGSWPVSSDRMVWALAAWEIYLTTGDRAWLRQSYEIVRRSAQHDLPIVLNAENDLIRGESSFMDWREQTYPRWMDAVDIYQSQSLSNNAVHYQTYCILARMAQDLGEDGAAYQQRAQRIRTAMNRLLWMPAQGYYGEYLYGRETMQLSPRSESLGELLAILFDIASPSQQRQMLAHLPQLDYGAPTVYPQTPGIPPYHNESVWPFVQAFWNLAAAKNHSDALVADGLSILLRHTAFFLTNKENLVATTGSPYGTEINSSRQLWSVAGSLAMVYRVLFGMNFEEDGIRLAPMIPSGFDGEYQLSNLHYRQALLTLRIRGTGAAIRSQQLDGKPFNGRISSSIEGAHTIEIILARDSKTPDAKPIYAENSVAPDTPELQLAENSLLWKPVLGADTYRVERDGKTFKTVRDTVLALPENALSTPHAYQVAAFNRQGVASFFSAPVFAPLVVPAATATFENSATPLRLTRSTPPVAASIDLAAEGEFTLRIRYANGAGPKNTGNQCALRSLYIDDRFAGVAVMPQRGLGAWEDFGQSSSIAAHLTAGKHRIELRMETINNNMNYENNEVRVSRLELYHIEH
jgi:glycogen debranching enzyme